MRLGLSNWNENGGGLIESTTVMKKESISAHYVLKIRREITKKLTLFLQSGLVI